MTIVNESKIGVLFASVLAGILGLLLLRASTKDDNEVVTSSPNKCAFRHQNSLSR